MPKNTEKQAQRRKDAIFSAAFYSIVLALNACILLGVRCRYELAGFWGTVIALSALLELGMIIPIQITLHTRLKEIQGGEEDAAAQY